MPVKDEHKIVRQGKTFVLFAGLLDSFHSREIGKGDTRIVDTSLLQVPGKDNGGVAIVHATVGIKDDDGDWIVGPFTGIGDASKENTGKMIHAHIIRMAETRAKARALRDSENVAELVADDVPADETNDRPAPPRPNRPPDKVSTPSGGKAERGGALKAHDPAPDAMLEKLREAIRDSNWETVAEYEDSHKPLREMTVQEASKAIRSFG